MAIWQPGTLYSPGAIVSPATAPPVGTQAPDNPSFESGDVDWTQDSGWSIVNETSFDGAWSAKFVAAGEDGSIVNDFRAPVTPGKLIHAWCAVANSNPSSEGGGAVRLFWYDASNVLLSTSTGNTVANTGGSSWNSSDVTAYAPASAAYVSVGAYGYQASGPGHDPIRVDQFAWDYTYADVPEGLVYKAVQADVGTSASTEPVWPIVVGVQVVDNTVTWEAVLTDRVVWEATPILKSSGVEPTWPPYINALVTDGTINWQATAREITDDKCPHTAVVAIGASKVFAGDTDIISYSATINPKDWSSADDAGYLPFGLQTYGSNPVAAMGLYRSNLVAFNAAGFQMWQIDQDPANMALLDAVPVGCTYPRSLQPVSNDLVFLTQTGIRNIGIAGASTNLQAGDFGKQIDPLVLEKIIAGDTTPLGLFVPSLGQYWLFFGAEAFVLTINGNGTSDMSWSRYVFPSAIDDWTIHDGDLYLRSGTLVWRVDAAALVDDEGGDDVEFEGEVWWPYLDLGELGLQKMLHGFDLVCTGEVAVSFGWDQSNSALATTPYTLTGDTIPGGMIPLPINAPSLQMRLTFAANQAWEFNAASLYLQEQRRTA